MGGAFLAKYKFFVNNSMDILQHHSYFLWQTFKVSESSLICLSFGICLASHTWKCVAKNNCSMFIEFLAHIHLNRAYKEWPEYTFLISLYSCFRSVCLISYIYIRHNCGSWFYFSLHENLVTKHGDVCNETVLCYLSSLFCNAFW